MGSSAWAHRTLSTVSVSLKVINPNPLDERERERESRRGEVLKRERECEGGVEESRDGVREGRK